MIGGAPASACTASSRCRSRTEKEDSMNRHTDSRAGYWSRSPRTRSSALSSTTVTHRGTSSVRSVNQPHAACFTNHVPSASRRLTRTCGLPFPASIGKSSRHNCALISSMLKKSSDDGAPSEELASWTRNNRHSSGLAIRARHRSGLLRRSLEVAARRRRSRCSPNRSGTPREVGPRAAPRPPAACLPAVRRPQRPGCANSDTPPRADSRGPVRRRLPGGRPFEGDPRTDCRHSPARR